MKPRDPVPRPLVEQAIDDLSAILRLRAYVAPPVWSETNLTIRQLQLLMKLRRFGPVPMHRIAEWFALGNASATDVVDGLEQHGLVERNHVQRDRRIVETSLTAEGTHLIDEILGVRREGFRAVLEALNDRDLALLHRLLGQVIAAADSIARSEPPFNEPAGNDMASDPTVAR